MQNVNAFVDPNLQSNLQSKNSSPSDLDPDRIAKLLELAAKLKRQRVKGMKAPTAKR